METVPAFASQAPVPRQRQRNPDKYPGFPICGSQTSATQARKYVAGQVTTPLIQALQTDGLTSNAQIFDPSLQQQPSRRRPRRPGIRHTRWAPYALAGSSNPSYDAQLMLSSPEMSRQRGACGIPFMPPLRRFGADLSSELSLPTVWRDMGATFCQPCCRKSQSTPAADEALGSCYLDYGDVEVLDEKPMPGSFVITQPYTMPELIGSPYFDHCDTTDTAQLLSQDPLSIGLQSQCQVLASTMTPQATFHDNTFLPLDDSSFTFLPEPVGQDLMFPDIQQPSIYMSAPIPQPISHRLDAGYLEPTKTILAPVRPRPIEEPTGPFDIVQPSQRGAKRGPFKEQRLREQTAFTRKWGACGRCKMQRIRCDFDDEDPFGPCSRCRGRTKPNADQLLCFRSNLTDIRLYKPGQVPGYEWTRRWNHNASNDIENWASDDTKTIYISAGFSTVYMECMVKPFIPQKGDKLKRSWVHEGLRRSVEIPPWAAVQLGDVKKAYEQHMIATEMEAIRHVVGSASPLLWSTYEFAAKLRTDPNLSSEARLVLNLTFKLWMAVRFSTRSTWIVGTETLGMLHNILDETSPEPGKIPLPPVLGAQLDNVLIHDIQTQVRHDLLTKFQHMLQHSRRKNWLAIYLVTFILLHNAALIIGHDASYAKKHGMSRRFAREDKVQEYHHGANTLLWYFRYTNKSNYPFSNACRDDDLRSFAELTDDQLRFVKQTRVFISMHGDEWAQTRREKRYEHGFYYISQMYEASWQAEPCHIGG